MPEKYKLSYFNGPGRGEAIRVAFAYGKTPFEDVRIQQAEWPEVKRKMPWGQMPLLEVGDGTVIAQSLAILRFVAKKFNLYGQNDYQAAKCDEYGYVLEDLRGEMYKCVFSQLDAAGKAELKATFISTTISKIFGKFEQVISSTGGPYLQGGVVTFADIILVTLSDALETSIDQTILSKYPGIKKLKDTVFALPGIKEYIASRPK